MNKFLLAAEAFSYDPATGQFYWKERPREHFKTEGACSRFNRHTAGKPVPMVYDKDGYRLLRMTCHAADVPRVELKAHRVAWFLHFGKEPTGQIDHINRDEADNRIANLRDVTPSLNQRNKRLHANNKSGVAGVRFRPEIGLWRAEITINKRNRSLGSFKAFADAVRARREAERQNGFLVMEARRGL